MTRILVLVALVSGCASDGEDSAAMADMLADCPDAEERSERCDPWSPECCEAAGAADCATGLIAVFTANGECMRDYCAAYCAAGCEVVPRGSDDLFYYCACQDY